jgi:hypothetical protein
MSTLKTSDNATLPEPVGSPGRKLQRQQAKGSKGLDEGMARAAPRSVGTPPASATDNPVGDRMACKRTA